MSGESYNQQINIRNSQTSI